MVLELRLEVAHRNFEYVVPKMFDGEVLFAVEDLKASRWTRLSSRIIGQGRRCRTRELGV